MAPPPTSTLISELESLTELASEMTRRARVRGAFLVWRAQARRVASVLLRPTSTLPADARALLRADATKLRGEIAKAKDAKALSPEAKAHLYEAFAQIDEALKAPLTRQGV